MSHDKLTLKDSLDLYYYLILTRRFEEALIKLYNSGKIRSHPHSSIGQEAIGVGSVFCLFSEDLIFPSLRSIGAILTKRVPPKLLMAEAFRKKSSPSGGKWLYHHVGVSEYGVILSSAVVAGSLPVAVGASLASKMKNSDQVTLVFFGDGATSRGDFHEAINFASVFTLPIVFICENNMYALSTPQSRQMNVADIADRASGYGIPGVKADGCNVLNVYHETNKAIERARKGDGPTLIEYKVYRWRGHSEIDDEDMGRPKDELDYWRNKCRPIESFRDFVLDNFSQVAENINQIEKRVDAEISEAVEFAESSPEPSPEEALRDVFA